MSEATDGLDVEIKDDVPAATSREIDVETPKVEPKPDATADDHASAIANLKGQLAQERESRERDRLAREDAERRAIDAQNRARAAEAATEDGQLQILNTALEAVKGTQANLKAQLKSAYAAQDHDAAAEIQEQMAIAAAQRLQLENGKQALENAPKQPVHPMPRTVDPVEELAASLSPRSAAWVRAHPDYARDPRKMQKMLAAHNLAVADDIQPDTDEYFSRVERTLGITQDRRDDGDEAEPEPHSAASEPTRTRQTASAVASVSRTAPTTSGKKPNTIRLTRDQMEAAELSGLSYEDYARNIAALRRDGRMN